MMAAEFLVAEILEFEILSSLESRELIIELFYDLNFGMHVRFNVML